MEGSETLASPTADVWISFLFPHRSILTSSVFHFQNDYQVQGQNFFPPLFLPSGNADSSIWEKCPCVFAFRLRYLTSASACSYSSNPCDTSAWNSLQGGYSLQLLENFVSSIERFWNYTFSEKNAQTINMQIVCFILWVHCLEII